MKRIMPVLLITFFMQAQEGPDLKKQLALYKKYKTEVIKSIQNSNSKKFENSLKFCMGNENEDPSTTYPIITPLLKKSDQFIESLKTLLVKPKKDEKINLVEKRNKALLNFQKRIIAFTDETFIQEKDCTFGMHIWKLWDGIRYLGAAFGLWVLGTISYTGGMENINPVPTQEFIYNCLGMPHTIPVVLESGENTAFILYALCAAATWYGGKNIYDALLYKRNLIHNRKELKSMQILLDKKINKKNQI